jgi:hypothetical protein
MTSDRATTATFGTLSPPSSGGSGGTGGTGGTGGGGGTGGNQQTSGTEPAPRCTLTLKSAKVLLTHHIGKRSKTATPALGVLEISVTCNEAAKVSLTGTLTEVLKKRGRHSTRTLSLRALVGNLTAHAASIFTEKLSDQALAGLRGGKRESVVFKLVAVNTNGHSTLTSRAIRLAGVKGS